jgi:hypothetical protein
MKRCTKCKKDKDINQYNFKIISLGIKSSVCKECSRLLIKNHYNENREYYINKAKLRNYQIKQRVLNYIYQYLSKNHCKDCGESDITVLEFDHSSKFIKIGAVSSLIKNKYPLNKVIDEISKCEVRCANCHRRKTAREFNWAKNKKHS